jgi:hypothetical protein
MNGRWSLAFAALMALGGCASETVLRVSDSAPQEMRVTWVRVEHLDDLAHHCSRSGVHRGERAAACADVLPSTGACTIYTWRHVTTETLGHELAHCFLGAWHP